MADSADGFVAQGYTSPNIKPQFRPAGAGQSGGWSWNGQAWVWATSPTTNGANPPGQKSTKVGGYVTGVAGPATGVNSSGTPGVETPDDQRIRAEGLASRAAQGPNPFGNEMQGYVAQYTPFGLSQPSAFGGGYGGLSQTPYSYASDNLVPSLEQRRMGMLAQLLGGR